MEECHVAMTASGDSSVPCKLHKGTLTNITNAYNAESHLNALRNNYREAVVEEIDNGSKNYQTSVYYMDIMNELEHMGDYMINVSQDLERAFVHKK